MTRIIAGSARGRNLKVPKNGTRPTSDRVRESLFSTLDHHLGDWTGLKVLDLYAGSGAFGFEALSRGAESAILVDAARGAFLTCRENAEMTGLPAKSIHSDAATFLRVDNANPFDVVFADPPYEHPESEITELLGLLTARTWLADEALVVIERPKIRASHGPAASPAPWPAGFELLKERRFGDTIVRLAIWYVSDADPDGFPAGQPA